MVVNTLTIKCDNHKILEQIKEILLEEDDYGRKIFTMKRLLPLTEDNYETNELRKYDYTWNSTNHGITQNIISDLILEEPDQLTFYYHSMSWVHRSWLTVLGNYIKALLPPSEIKEQIGFTLDHTFYDMDQCSGSHYFWDGSEKGSSISYHGLIDFASKHHPGLLNYLKIQDEQYNSTKTEVMKSVDNGKNTKTDSEEKNNSTKNEESWKK